MRALHKTAINNNLRKHVSLLREFSGPFYVIINMMQCFHSTNRLMKRSCQNQNAQTEDSEDSWAQRRTGWLDLVVRFTSLWSYLKLPQCLKVNCNDYFYPCVFIFNVLRGKGFLQTATKGILWNVVLTVVLYVYDYELSFNCEITDDVYDLLFLIQCPCYPLK